MRIPAVFLEIAQVWINDELNKSRDGDEDGRDNDGVEYLLSFFGGLNGVEGDDAEHRVFQKAHQIERTDSDFRRFQE